MSEIIAGRNPIREALKAGRAIGKMLVQRGEKQGSLIEILAMARERGIVVQEAERSKLDEIAPGVRHQGVVAYVAPREFSTVEEILDLAKSKGEPPLLLLLDELEDPHNVGALLRTADAAGVHGVLLPKRRSASITPAVAKSSAGAVEYVPVAQIGNVAQTIESLKQQGLWVIGADMDGAEEYYRANLTGPMVIVVGSEGKGLGRLVKERCDILVKIPMKGMVTSLNASVAGSLLMYEILRQRER